MAEAVWGVLQHVSLEYVALNKPIPKWANQMLQKEHTILITKE